MSTTKTYISFDKLSKYHDLEVQRTAAEASEVLAQAKKYTDDSGALYDPAGAATTAEANAKAYADGKDTAIAEAKKAGDDAAAAAKTADDKAVAAQGEVDALELLVGTLPEGATATTVVGYVDAKTANIASNETVGALDERMTQAETDIDNIEKDYLKAADKTELEGEIGAVQTAVDTEKTRAEGIEGGLDARIKAVEDDYLKGADKTELQGNIETVANAVEVLTEGVDAEKVDGVKDLIKYVEDHGSEVTGMKEDIAGNSEAIEGVAGRVTTLEGEMDAVEKAVADEKTRAEGVEAGLAGRIETLETAVGDGGSVDEMIDAAIEVAMGEEATRVDGLLAGKVDKVEGKGLSANDLTNELKANYDDAYTHSQEAHAPANAQENVIEAVKVNGVAVAVEGKAVNIAVPTDNAELTNGAGYLVANDIANKADKATTLAGYGITDAYTSAQTDEAIAAAVGMLVEASDSDINSLFA